MLLINAGNAVLMLFLWAALSRELPFACPPVVIEARAVIEAALRPFAEATGDDISRDSLSLDGQKAHYL